MRICSLASSSKGNCILVYTENVKILIDLGVTIKDVVSKLARLDIGPNEIDGILITHEHSDHIKGVKYFVKKFGTKIYCHKDAYDSLIRKMEVVDGSKFALFTDSPFLIKDFEIQPFNVCHDVPKCVGYSIINDGKKFSIATDIGVMTDLVLQHLKGSKLVMLESNHDEQKLLANPKYPIHLKKRILSNLGHLSNINCAKTIQSIFGFGTKQVMLAHLSEENNTPNLALSTIVNYLHSININEGQDIFINVAPATTLSPIFYLK